MAKKEPKPADKPTKPSKAEEAWEEAKQDIPRHDAEFDAKHGKGRDQ